MMRLNTLGIAAAIAGGLGLATAANAAPIAPAQLGPSGEGAVVEKAGLICGPGFHLNPWGVCRPNWGPRRYWGGPVYRPYGYYRPRPFYRPYGYGPRPFF